MEDHVYRIIQEAELYQRTGIQRQSFNTIFQLMAVKEKERDLLEKAESLLMIPDYFHFLLTGKKAAEYTNATTTQLVNAETGDWDWKLIERLGFPRKIFQKIAEPGTVLGELKEEIREEVGFGCRVVLPATHDTGSAVLAMPCAEGTGLYLSSGTWSLMGTEVKRAVLSPEAMKANLTNEGGYNRRFRFLKNIMGLWMIQSVRHEDGDAYSFAQICAEAETCRDFPSRVDVNDDGFLAPESMKEAVREYLKKTGQPVPGDPRGDGRCDLPEPCGMLRKDCERDRGDHGQKLPRHLYHRRRSKRGLLKPPDAARSQRVVSAGPTEATAIGNLAVQMITEGIFADLEETRKCIRKSFEIKYFEP